MPKKKKAKQKDPISVFDDAPTSLPEPKNILVHDLESLKKSLKKHKLNPMERVMAVNLITRGYQFYCQYRIDLEDGDKSYGRNYFVVDFYIPAYIDHNKEVFIVDIVIETDGKIHETEENQEKDRSKNNFLTGMGYRVFRFTWDQVMQADDGYDALTHVTELCDKIATDIGFERFDAGEKAYTQAKKEFGGGKKK